MEWLGADSPSASGWFEVTESADKKGAIQLHDSGLLAGRSTIVLSSLLCLLPLALYRDKFRTLYWFHDDWELLFEMANTGLARWIVQRFAESFVPVFKLFWISAIHLFHGSYFAMILLLWATHLAVLFSLGNVLRQCHFPGSAVSLSVITLGLAWSNIESLGWATQWSALLSVLFYLLAWTLLLRAEAAGRGVLLPVLVGLFTLASVLCFARGLMTGILLAFFLVLAPAPGLAPRWRGGLTFCLLMIAAISLLLAYRGVAGSHPNFQGLGTLKLATMAAFGVCYELLNPLFWVLPIPRKAVDPQALVIAGFCKALIVGLGLRIAGREQRRVLWTLLLFDLGNALLLGLERYHTGILMTVSYRYQYVSLLCFGPFLGVVAAHGTAFLSRRPLGSRAVLGVILLGWALLLGYPWRRHIDRWSRTRGIEVRRALAAAAPDQRFGRASLAAGSARELVALYHLH